MACHLGITVLADCSELKKHTSYMLVVTLFVGVQEEQRIRAKQAKEDLEQFLLNNDKMNSSVKYWSAYKHLFAVLG